MKWYRRAADQGDADAQNNLGFMYAKGRGVLQDDAEAEKWYRRAPDQDLAGAQLNLGMMYTRGQGVPQDDAEAAKWYRLAADQGNASAQYNLGATYAAGKGVPQDNILAYMWLSLSAAAGDQDATKILDFIAGQMTPKQIAKAQKLAREWRPKGHQKTKRACRKTTPRQGRRRTG